MLGPSQSLKTHVKYPARTFNNHTAARKRAALLLLWDVIIEDCSLQSKHADRTALTELSDTPVASWIWIRMNV